MPRFKQYMPGDRQISASDLNARSQVLESLLRSLPGNCYVGPDGVYSRRVPADMGDGSTQLKFLAWLTGFTVMPGQLSVYRFEYGWEQVQLESGGLEAEVVGGGLNGSRAVNLAEMHHIEDPRSSSSSGPEQQPFDTWMIYGVDILAEDYEASGYVPIPPSGTYGAGGAVWHHHRVVEMTQVIDPDDNTVTYFSENGTHDGPC